VLPPGLLAVQLMHCVLSDFKTNPSLHLLQLQALLDERAKFPDAQLATCGAAQLIHPLPSDFLIVPVPHSHVQVVPLFTVFVPGEQVSDEQSTQVFPSALNILLLPHAVQTHS